MGRVLQAARRRSCSRGTRDAEGAQFEALPQDEFEDFFDAQELRHPPIPVRDSMGALSIQHLWVVKGREAADSEAAARRGRDSGQCLRHTDHFGSKWM